MKLGRAGASEVADLGVMHLEPVVEMIDQLRDEEVEVRPSLTMAVGREIDRHPVDTRLEIGAVIEVEAAHEVLVRLSLAGVLGDDHTGHGLEELAGARDGSCAQIDGAHAASEALLAVPMRSSWRPVTLTGSSGRA